jgi:tetratricopeptide (TPR) repeat protein
VILEFDGKEESDNIMLLPIIADTPINRTVDVVIWRGGREQNIRLTVGHSKWLDYMRAATAAFDKRQADQAIRLYTNAVNIPDLPTTHKFHTYLGRGDAHADKYQYDKAIADYDRAIQNMPDSAMAYNKRGMVWKEKGQRDKAIPDLKKAVSLAPNGQPWKQNLEDMGEKP